jgi:hypothetical protein
MPNIRTPIRLIRRSLRYSGIAALAALTFSGCGLVGGKEPVKIDCPPYGMLREGASLTRYAPNAPHDLTNVELAAQLVDVSASCVLEADPRQITMKMGVRVLAERGPAAGPGEQRLGYIVAITKPDQTFLNRKVYGLAATFKDNSRRAGFEEVLTMHFPLAKEQVADDFRVYVTLELRPEELDTALQPKQSR